MIESLKLIVIHKEAISQCFPFSSMYVFFRSVNTKSSEKSEATGGEEWKRG